MTRDQRTLLLVDFYRSSQSLEDAYTAFEQGRLDLADAQLMNAIAVAERLRDALKLHLVDAISRGTSPPHRAIGGKP